MHSRRRPNLSGRRGSPAARTALIAGFAIACATSARFEDRKSCEKAARRDFDQCTDATLSGSLNQQSAINYGGQVDPSEFRNPPSLDRKSCNHSYERQLKECSVLPDEPTSDKPIPEAPPPGK